MCSMLHLLMLVSYCLCMFAVKAEEQEVPVHPALVVTKTDPGVRQDAAPQQPVDEDAEPTISDVDMTPDQVHSIFLRL